QLRGFGVLLDQSGKPEAQQTWGSANQWLAQLENVRLQPQATARQHNVWFPANYLPSMGVTNATPFQAGGAYLSFPTAVEAQAHVQKRGFGVILNAKGDVDATQPWAQIAQVYNQIPGVNARLSASPTPGKYHVWIPLRYV